MDVHFAFDNSYARLGPAFHRASAPTPVAAPRLLKLNRRLAAELGLDADALEGAAGAQILSGNRLPQGAEPIAAAYAGHQFGHFVPQLGDGRAILLGEIVDRQGRRRDVQLKGSGPTAFSRSGDGRAALGPVLREYLVSEAMAALGVPTTRALAAVANGEAVYRETALPGAVLTRVASSHIRVGTFQFFAARGQMDALARLADHAMARHDPEALGARSPYRAFLEGVCRRQARLVAQWMQVGFVHGVMNTDNMSVSGETIDYGPCAFLDAHDPKTVFSSIDRGGRYAYANQPAAANWNLARLAESLLPLLDPDETKAIEIAREALGVFAPAFDAAYVDGFRAKIGLQARHDDDPGLIAELLRIMESAQADHTLTFRRLGRLAAEPLPAQDVDEGNAASPRALFADPAAFDGWSACWRDRLSRETVAPAARRAAMDRVNPAVIPRNHHVEEALAAAMEGDLAPFEQLNEALADPFGEAADRSAYAAPPPVPDTAYRTFCGT